jgi:mono/diheme cytochrome c family protein
MSDHAHHFDATRSNDALRALVPALPGRPGGRPTIVRSVLLVAVVLLASSVHAQDGGTLAARGREVFRDQGCYGCHTVGATGTPIATDLSRIGARRDQAYLAGWLRDPSLQRPTAHMPKIQLSEAEVQALAAYLGSLR